MWLTKPDEAGHFFALVSMKSPYFLPYAYSEVLVVLSIFRNQYFYTNNHTFPCIFTHKELLKFYQYRILSSELYSRLVDCIFFRGRRGRDRMIVGFTTTYVISAHHH